MKHLSPAQQKRGFNIHVLCAVLSIVAAVVVNLLIGPPFWFHWVLLGLGIGLICHWWWTLGPGARKVPSVEP